MSFLLETIRLGLGNLRLHMLRSVLTCLGIILGVGAVIVMVSIGEGNKQAALRDIQALGATNVIIRSEQPPETTNLGGEERQFVASYGITRADLRRLEHFLGGMTMIVPLKAVGDEISFRARRLPSQSFGTTPALLEVARLSVARGRYITEHDMMQHMPVAVIGDQVASQLFGNRDPLGQNFRIGERLFKVVGVLRPVGLAGGKGGALVGRDLNKDVHLPLSTAELEFGDVVTRRQSGNFSREKVELSEVYVTARDTDSVIDVASRARRIIESDHKDQRDFQIIVPWELLENVKKTQMVWNVVLISIAAISLLVGGIGIMNIMLATVTERTREIGIRRALGATRRHIVAQFLVETGSLSTVGGVVGIALGVGVSLVLGRALPWVLDLPLLREVVEAEVNLETRVTAWSIVTSFAVATIVGLVFGIYPALVASRQDPIVALRHD